MANNTFPSDWEDLPCFLVAVPRPLIPFVGGLMKILEQRGFWASETDYESGLAAVIQFEECLTMTCLDVLLEQNAQLYRMLNTAIFGQLYSVDEGPPIVVTPAIAPAVDLTVLDQDSVMGRLDRLAQLIDNRLAGTETPLYADLPGIKQQLQSIIDALASEDTDLGSILAELEVVAGLLA
jgi:hypothetical protein